MSSASSSRRGAPPAPYIPIIRCPECARLVKKGTSGTSKHPGWVYYKCEKHARGCVFWHWEHEYVYYLVEHNFLVGTAGADVVGWAEDRREAQELRQEEQAATSPAQDHLVMQMMSSVADMMKETIFMLMVLVVLVVVCCVVLILKK